MYDAYCSKQSGVVVKRERERTGESPYMKEKCKIWNMRFPIKSPCSRRFSPFQFSHLIQYTLTTYSFIYCVLVTFRKLVIRISRKFPLLPSLTEAAEASTSDPCAIRP